MSMAGFILVVVFAMVIGSGIGFGIRGTVSNTIPAAPTALPIAASTNWHFQKTVPIGSTYSLPDRAGILVVKDQTFGGMCVLQAFINGKDVNPILWKGDTYVFYQWYDKWTNAVEDTTSTLKFTCQPDGSVSVYLDH